MTDRPIRLVAFILRCSGAATSAYLIAGWVGLPHAIWALMSALIVSQEKLQETQASLTSRILGTFVGVGVAIAVSLITARFATDTTVKIAAGVAICALFAHGYPALRVCMWTCPIVLLTEEPSVPTEMVGFYRGCEVTLGALIGAAFHWVAEGGVAALRRKSSEPVVVGGGSE